MASMDGIYLLWVNHMRVLFIFQELIDFACEGFL